jgi:hypothetical protein
MPGLLIENGIKIDASKMLASAFLSPRAIITASNSMLRPVQRDGQSMILICQRFSEDHHHSLRIP